MESTALYHKITFTNRRQELTGNNADPMSNIRLMTKESLRVIEIFPI